VREVSGRAPRNDPRRAAESGCIEAVADSVVTMRIGDAEHAFLFEEREPR
jgi:hypothetical protein